MLDLGQSRYLTWHGVRPGASESLSHHNLSHVVLRLAQRDPNWAASCRGESAEAGIFVIHCDFVTYVILHAVRLVARGLLQGRVEGR